MLYFIMYTSTFLLYIWSHICLKILNRIPTNSQKKKEMHKIIQYFVVPIVETIAEHSRQPQFKFPQLPNTPSNPKFLTISLFFSPPLLNTLSLVQTLYSLYKVTYAVDIDIVLLPCVHSCIYTCNAQVIITSPSCVRNYDNNIKNDGLWIANHLNRCSTYKSVRAMAHFSVLTPFRLPI
jgi:hypothetical protein